MPDARPCGSSLARSLARSLAIATTIFVGKRPPGLCSLASWCVDAIRLSQMPYLIGCVEVVILTNSNASVRNECPQPAVRLLPFTEDSFNAIADYISTWPSREAIAA
mmetsp:Transcript_41673/g.97854  ORF Transcript_41673/g.97854 Transcript_41673/m.97854 type:complete len:107 (+) Transcript_41673:152-472(+)